jgi:acetate kinase
MGFIPLDGLIMNTGSGSIDPGILIHLLKNCLYTGDQLDQVLNRQLGLKGISGVPADMRQVFAASAQGNSRARLAVDALVHRIRTLVGSMVASLAARRFGVHRWNRGKLSRDPRCVLQLDVFGSKAGAR